MWGEKVEVLFFLDWLKFSRDENWDMLATQIFLIVCQGEMKSIMSNTSQDQTRSVTDLLLAT